MYRKVICQNSRNIAFLFQKAAVEMPFFSFCLFSVVLVRRTKGESRANYSFLLAAFLSPPCDLPPHVPLVPQFLLSQFRADVYCMTPAIFSRWCKQMATPTFFVLLVSGLIWLWDDELIVHSSLLSSPGSRLKSVRLFVSLINTQNETLFYRRGRMKA